MALREPLTIALLRDRASEAISRARNRAAWLQSDAANAISFEEMRRRREEADTWRELANVRARQFLASATAHGFQIPVFDEQSGLDGLAFAVEGACKRRRRLAN